MPSFLQITSERSESVEGNRNGESRKILIRNDDFERVASVFEALSQSLTSAFNHRLSIHGFEALLKVVDKVLSDKSEPFLSSDNGLQRCPFGPEFLFASYHIGVNFRTISLRWSGRVATAPFSTSCA